MTKEALKLALEALGWTDEWRPQGLKEEAITAIKEALAQPEQKSVAMADYMALTEKYVALKAAQPEQEPVAWIYSQGTAKVASMNYVPGVRATPLYTSPPAQRTWVGLTDVEIVDIMDVELTTQNTEHFALCQAIEAKLREKNI